MKPCVQLINNEYMLEQQKEYAKNFLMEIYNQSSSLYTGNTTVDGRDIESGYSFDWEQEEENLIELGSYDGFTASYKHGLEWRRDFSTEGNGVDEMEHIDGYFSLYILFFESETKLICEIVKDIDNVKGCGGISYEPVNELVYEKSINWQDLNDYDFQIKEYEFFKQAIQNKQF